MIQIGSAVGNYVIRSVLGEGAMGTVFLAEHPIIGSRVAIKVIKHAAAKDRDSISRFFTEARAVNKIGHENIVTISDLGETDEGDVYFVMEHLEGQTLAALMRERRLGLDELVHVAAQIADALEASHRKGIVHRDLKPGNVYLVRRARDPLFVKVLDFGIAKLTGGDDDPGHKTETGSLLGTPYYMAPEQCVGQRAIDGRADIYSLGVMLFEMATGRLPFEAKKWTEVIIHHVTLKPPRARTMDAACPAWLDALADACLHKEPDERPASMAAVRDALQARDAEALSAKPLPATRQAPPAEPLALADTMAPTVPRDPERQAEKSTLEGAAREVSGSRSASTRLSRRMLGVGALAVIAAAAGAAIILWSGSRTKDTPRAPVAAPSGVPPDAAPRQAAAPVPALPDAGAMAVALPDAGAATAPPPAPKPAAPAKAGTKRGWVYLGDYDGSTWTTRYFDTPRTAPARLIGRVVEPLGHANVRATMPSVMGEMGKTIGKVDRGTKLTIDRVSPWEGTSYIWAEVHYARP